MASNLFLLKGWTITLIAALFALSAKDANKAYVLVAYFPALVFWVLDGYFLSQERKFRSLYDYVRRQDEADIDFSMDTSAFSQDFRNTWWGGICSKTLAIYYGSMIAIMFLIMFFIR